MEEKLGIQTNVVGFARKQAYCCVRVDRETHDGPAYISRGPFLSLLVDLFSFISTVSVSPTRQP